MPSSSCLRILRRFVVFVPTRRPGDMCFSSAAVDRSLLGRARGNNSKLSRANHPASDASAAKADAVTGRRPQFVPESKITVAVAALQLTIPTSHRPSDKRESLPGNGF
jgi:hypothetical protein